MEPKNINATDTIATVDATTYGVDSIPFEHSCTHVSLRFKGVGPGFKVLSAATINYEREGE
jgi:hypothetical protein